MSPRTMVAMWGTPSMIEVEIQNFQSIDKVAFKIEGFTVLVGRSNIGKSALIRAIHCALTGASGTDFVRHGLDCERRIKGNKKCKCKSTVLFKTPSLHLIWEKGDADNQYTLVKDGVPTTFTAVSRGTPDFLLPDFAQVAIGDSTELIQVSEQFEPIFLLKKSGSVIADVLSDVAKLDDINVAMKLVAADRREAITTRNVRDKDVVQIKADLRQYDDLDATTARAEALQRKHQDVQQVTQQVAELESFVEDQWTLSTGIERLKRVAEVELPEAVSFQKLGSDLLTLQRFLSLVKDLKPVVQRLVGVSKTAPPEIEGLRAALKEVARLGAWQQKTAKLEMIVAKDLSKLPEPSLDALKVAATSTSQLSRWAVKYETLRSKVDQLDKQLTAVVEEETKVLADFAALGICPTCSLPLHPEHRASA